MWGCFLIFDFALSAGTCLPYGLPPSPKDWTPARSATFLPRMCFPSHGIIVMEFSMNYFQRPYGERIRWVIEPGIIYKLTQIVWLPNVDTRLCISTFHRVKPLSRSFDGCSKILLWLDLVSSMWCLLR
ncbi:hypothetical protein NA56DRAFT_299385 [Hyaloscypha hepaticicola]|uniref:Uncharacterized protein n=1 Tax=Hyaloscypha hepaticicola TaxID=2082293 RepID=A0A2J6QKU6_9HELO|nr:hypothetical protein NA56DRAFT_299385 [Hyaloscypha hepaticicola]